MSVPRDRSRWWIESPPIIRIWDIAAKKELLSLSHQDTTVVSLTFSPDNKLLASGGNSETVGIWRVASGNRIKTLRDHRGWVHSVAFSPDGKVLVSGGSDRMISFWDTEQWEIFAKTGQRTPHMNLIRDMVFTPDGRFLIAACVGTWVNIFDPASGRLLLSFRGHTKSLYCIAISPDGKSLAIGGTATVMVWDIAKWYEAKK